MNRPSISVDHIVLVTSNVEKTLEFYERVLGAEIRDADAWRRGDVEYPVLHFQTFKFNVHPADTHASPRAAIPATGSLDIAFHWNGDIASAAQHLRSHDVDILLGPVPQEGARGAAESVYFRDLDGALIELICYPSDAVLDQLQREDDRAEVARPPS